MRKIKHSKHASDKKYLTDESPPGRPSPDNLQLPAFSGCPDGTITHVMTKHYGWQPITIVNIYFLRNVLRLLEAHPSTNARALTAIRVELNKREAQN